MKYSDTSAFVKYYAEEDFETGAEKIQELIRSTRAGKVALKSSAILVGESIAFDRWLRIGIFDNEKFDKVVSEFLNDITLLRKNGALLIEDIDTHTTINCVGYIIKYHLSLNDAIHLYTALSNTDKIGEFICSDANLIKAAKNEGLKVLNPED